MKLADPDETVRFTAFGRDGSWKRYYTDQDLTALSAPRVDLRIAVSVDIQQSRRLRAQGRVQ